MNPSTLPLIRVESAGGGRWQVVVPDRGTRVICETLDDARRVADVRAAPRRPCELLVRDAYHHVIFDELLPVSSDSSQS